MAVSAINIFLPDEVPKTKEKNIANLIVLFIVDMISQLLRKQKENVARASACHDIIT